MQNVSKKIWQWYKTHPVHLPWRTTRDPYAILVSEVMLQQTQIPRVLMKYPLFLKRFPTIKHLARANLSSVLLAWRGMGYNRRALYLKKTAEEIQKKYAGNLPSDEASLRSLPGIGPYTARAIRCFAFGLCEPFIETNIRRVIIHEFFPDGNKVSDTVILEVLAAIQPKTKTREWYYALMDYGRDALKGTPNANRRSKHYTKQSRFEGSMRYIRAKIISYLIANKKATAEELFLSLKEDRHLEILSQEDISRAYTTLLKEGLVRQSGNFFRIS